MNCVTLTDLKHKVFSKKDLYSDDKPYITTNESNTENVLSFLAKQSVSNDPLRLHIGFSGWYNFDIIKATDAQYAILADVSRRTAELFKATKKTISLSHDRFEFIEKIVKIFESNEFYRPLEHAKQNQSNNLRKELNNPLSWLGDDHSFEKIKNMYATKKILFAGLDITNIEVCKKLSLWIQSNHLNLHTLYVSNIGDILMHVCIPEADKDNSYLSQMKQALSHILCKNNPRVASVIDATRVDHEYDNDFDNCQHLLDSAMYTPFLLREERIKKAQAVYLSCFS